MGITAMKKVFPAYKFKEYEPDGNGAGDWRNQEADISTLDIFKPNSKKSSFSIVLNAKKAGNIDYLDTDYKTRENIGVGSTLGDLIRLFPNMYIALIGGFDNVTQKETVVITALTKSYPNLQFNITSTAELDKMDIDKIDRNSLPTSLKIDKVSLLSFEANKNLFDEGNLLVSKEEDRKGQVNKPASFPGGEETIAKLLSKTMRYPRSAQEKGIQGTVKIKFTIDETGRILNPVPITHFGGGLEDEALRVVKSMPNWLPAIKDGKQVAEEKTFPLRFMLAN